MKNFILLSCCFFVTMHAWSQDTSNTLRVKWDCQILEDHELNNLADAEDPHPHLDCDELSDAFFGSLSFFNKVTSDETIVLRLRTFPHISGDGLRFIATAEGVPGTYFEGMNAEGQVHIRSSDDDNKQFLKALNVIQRSVLIFAQTQGEIRTNENGQATITFSPHTQTGSTPVVTNNRPWYLDFGFSGQYALRRMLSTDANPNFVLSKEKWVLRVYAGFNYTRLTFSMDDQATGESIEQTESNISSYASVRLSYSFKPNWSVAIMSTVAHAPQTQNYDRQNNADVGIEWILRPRRRIEDNVQAGVQYIIGFGQENYNVITADGMNSRLYPRHGLRAFLLWHVSEVLDIQGSVTSRMALNNPRFSNLGLDSQVSWLVSSRPIVRLNLNMGLNYTPHYLNEPDINSPGALTVLNGGANFEPLNFNLGLEFLFRLGTNQATERRWENRP